MGLEEFRNHCEEHQGYVDTRPQSRTHDSLVRRVVSDPTKIGIINAGDIFEEVELDTGNGVGPIDIVIFSQDGEVYICEAKTGYKPGEGGAQLDVRYNYVRDNFGILPVRVKVKGLPKHKIKYIRKSPEMSDVFDIALG